jgi:aspartate/methionine/tyrosine aminotransferase
MHCRITLPPAVHEAAAAKGKPADYLYCNELLEQTGIVVVPGEDRQAGFWLLCAAILMWLRWQ